MSKKNKNLKIRYLLCLLLTAVFVLCTNATRTQAVGPIGSVEFVHCLQTDESIDCDEAMIVTVPITFGRSSDWEFVTLSNIPPIEGQALEEAVNVEITKSVPKLVYTLRYFHTVAYYPHEEVIKVPHPITGCEGCLDCSGATSPTCGWTYSGSTKIPHSQGFCSIKSPFDLEHSESSCWWWRGEKLLDEKATIENPFSTAHCLRQGDVYFHGYEISEYNKSYEISFKIIQGSEEHTFALSPKDPLYSTKTDDNYAGTFNLKAELIGDMEPYSGAVELDNYILYIPSAPDTHEMVIDYQNNMLLVPREEVSKDGSEPDKVGVSFKTFRSLGSDYKVSEAGDGLGNQLFHKHNFDLQKLTNNPSAETTYLVHGKRDFKSSMNFHAGMEKSLAHSLYEINNSLVSLTIDKAIIKHITTQSKGIIVEAEVEDFTSMSDDGVLNVIIKNIGDYKTDYIVTVTQATMNIHGWSGHGWAIPAQSRILQPDDEVKLKFDVTTRGNLDTSNEFKVSLKAPHGKVYDSVLVQFDTKKHQSEYSWQKYEKNNASDFELPDDTNAPVITLNGPNTMVLECGVDSYVELGAEAVDDTDPCVVVDIGGDTVDTSTCGTYVVVYSAIDSWCHFALVTRTVEVVDTTPPVITLIGPNTVVVPCGADYIESGATATDNCDDDVPVVIGGTVDTSTAGTYLLTYDAMDDSGNSASQVIRTVIVQAIPPDCSGAYAHPGCLWPPFHQMVPVNILGVTDADGDDIAITITGITSDEPTSTGKGCGGAKHAPDADGVGTDTALLRAERSGMGNGRVYVINFTAVDGQGAECQGSVQVNVPRGRFPFLRCPVPCEAVDDGQNYDATQMN